MSRRFRRLIDRVVSRFRLPTSLSKRAIRRPLDFTTLEERLAPALLSPPDQLLPPGTTPLSLALADLNRDGNVDIAVLGTNGILTVALNHGDNTWTQLTTSSLSITSPTGMAIGNADRDPIPDLIIQTPNGVTIATGDGFGRFGGFQQMSLGAAGSFAAPTGVRVDPIVTTLGGGVSPDIVAVAPQSNQVAVLRHTADGLGYQPAVRYATGGLVPVAVVAGQFIGDDLPDLAVGHRDGSVTFLEGQADGTFLLRPALTITGLGSITGLTATDLNGDGELDIVASGTDRVTLLRNGTDVVRNPVLVNGDFSQGLTGWDVTSGKVTAGGGFAQFREDGNALLSTLQQSFTVPTGATSLQFDVTAASLEALDGKLPDAFEVSLLGADGVPLVPSFRADASSFFNLSPGNVAGASTGTTFDGRHVSLNLAAIPAGTKATVVFDLIGNKPGQTSTASIDNVSVHAVVERVDTFTNVPLAGPFLAADAVASGDVTGDGKSDIVVADGSGIVLLTGDGAGGFVRSVYTPPGFGTSATVLAVAPLTSGDTVADVAVGYADTAKVATPLVTVAGAGLDLAPRLPTLATLSGVEGASVPFTTSFTDPDGAAGYTSTIDWGDGSTSPGSVTFANGTGTISASHVYADNGTYTVSVLLQTINAGPVDRQSTSATITNALPTATANDLTLTVGDSTEVTVGSFTDAGFSLPDNRTRETFLAKIDWGQGNGLTPFGRIVSTNGSPGVATTGTVYAIPTYTTPGIYTAVLTITDDDGGERTQTFNVTVKPKTADGVWWVPGAPGQAVSVQFDFLPNSSTDYANELAYFPVDDASGRIGTLLPSSPGYAAAAIARLNTTPIFSQTDQAGATAYRNFTAGQFVAFALVKNGSLTNLLANNPTGSLGNDPLVWFSTTAANADGGTQHFQRQDLAGGWVQYNTEDLTNGGDHDFNDLMFKTGPVRQNPSIQNLPAVTSNEGSAASITSSIVDPTPNETLSASINWGDGTTSAGVVTFANGAGTVTATHTYADNGKYTIALTVTDSTGLTAARSSSITVSNVAPTLTSASTQTGLANSVQSWALGSFSDPGFTFAPANTQETFTSTVNWGDGSPTESATVSVTQGSVGTATKGTLAGSHNFSLPGSYTVTSTVQDDDGGSSTTSFIVTVTANAPRNLVFSIPNSAEGSSVAVVGTFDDNDLNDTPTATINWGDGTTSNGSISYANGHGTISGSHIYADDKTGGYSAVLTVTDKYGLTASKSTTATVTNVAPTATAGAAASGLVGTPLTVALASFTDPGFTFAPASTQETFTATVNWGDATATESAKVTVTQGSAGTLTIGTTQATHTFSKAGTYTVLTTVSDDNGGTATASQTVTITSATPTGLGCWTMATPAITGISQASSITTGAASTSDTTIVIYGTGQPGASLTVKRAGQSVGTTVVAADGTWRFDYTGTVLSAGSYSFTVDQDPFGPMGLGGGFNAFIQNNVSGIPDAEGRLAAGGNVTLSNFSIAQLIPGSNYARDNLIAGGSLSLTGGQVFGGNAVYGTTASVSSNTTLQQGAVRKETIYDFASAFTDLRSKADTWAVIAANGSTTYSPTGTRYAITVAGTDPTFDAFTVDGSKLSSASSFTINAPATATVLINVTGTTGSMQNFAFYLNGGVIKQHVVFNFPQYTSLTLASIGVSGSVFAPRADVNFVGGNLDGTLVAKSLIGGGELHNYPFQSSCPISTSPAFTVTVQNPTTVIPPKFFVVGGTQTSRFSSTGTLLGTNAIAATGTVKGITSNSTGTATWVVVANGDGTTDVVQSDVDGSYRNTWRAYGVTDARDIATNGTDIWIVGKATGTTTFKLFRYTKGALVRSGGIEPTSVSLNSANTNPTGLATDGWNVFITDKTATGGKVFAYDINGTLLGNSQYNPWKLDATNSDPSGVALNPAGGNELWVVDKTAKKVFTYSNGRGNQYYNNGQAQTASSSFALPAGSTSPEGIVDPGPTTVNFDETVVDVLDLANEVYIYNFYNDTPGRRMYFDRLDNTPNINAYLQNEFSADPIFPGNGFASGDVDPVTLSVGWHYLYVFAPADVPVDLAFELVTVPDTVTTPINIGDTVNGSIDVVGQTNDYTFTASAGDQIYFIGNNNGLPFTWTLQDPNGATVFTVNSLNHTFTMPVSGTYTLTVDGITDTTGAFSFQTILEHPSVAIQLDDTINDSFTVSFYEVHSYTFQANAGQRVTVDPLPISTSSYGVGFSTTIYAPDGTLVYNPTAGLPQTGTYRLELTSQDQVGPFRAALVGIGRTPPIAYTTGTDATGHLAGPSDSDDYTFYASAGQSLHFVYADSEAKISVTDPTGAVFVSPQNNVDETMFVSRSGTYHISVTGPIFVSPNSLWNGNYTFRVTAAIPTATTIVPDQVVSDTVTGKGPFAVYAFSATAGQVFAFDSIPNGPIPLVIAPDGSIVRGPTSLNQEPVWVASQTGTYRVALFSFFNNDTLTSIGYQFAIRQASTLAVGSPTTLTVPPANQFTLYSFDGMVGDRYFIDVTGGAAMSGAQFQLIRPDGTSAWISPANVDKDLFTLDQNGTYALEVMNVFASESPGSFTFMNVPADETRPLERNTPVSGAIAEFGQRQRYTFTANAGEQVAFDTMLPTDPNSPTAVFRLLDPAGNVVFGPTTTDVGTTTLPTSGTYTLEAMGYYATQGVKGAYRFQLQTVAPVATGPATTTSGTDFLGLFPNQFQYQNNIFGTETQPATPALFVSSTVETSGVVLMERIGRLISFTVPAGGTTRIDFPGDLESSRGNETTGNLSFRVLTLDPVVVTGLMYEPFNADSFAVYPTNSLGTDYRVMSPDSQIGFGGELSVVATQNNTTITITPAFDINTRLAGVPYTISLSAGETYVIGGTNNSRVTGTRVQSNLPVAVFGSDPFAQIPSAYGTANFLAEQMLPVSAWGTRAVTVPFTTRTGEFIRVLAAEDDTHVSINGSAVATLSAGQVYESFQSSSSIIEANRPIQVGQFAPGNDYDNTEGDPTFVLVPAVEQFRSLFTVNVTDLVSITRHYVNIVVPTNAAGTVQIDGTLVDQSSFTTTPGSEFSVAQLLVTAGTHTISASQPISVTSYGIGTDDMIGSIAGSGLASVPRVGAIDLTPNSAIGVLGTPTPFAVLVTDTTGLPLANTHVVISVVGVNPTTLAGQTDTTGHFAFSLTSPTVGIDSVTATAGTFSDTSTLQWNNPVAPPTIQIEDPTAGQNATAGRTLVVVGQAQAGTATSRITVITLNGVPVEAIDASGKFFAQFTPALGTNVLTAVVRDSNGQTATTTLTITGVVVDTSVQGFHETLIPAQLVYQTTTFNRVTGRLLADATIQNTSSTAIDGPIAAAFRNFDPAEVTLHGAAVDDRGFASVRFDGDIPAYGNGATQRITFDVPSRQRFDFDVEFLAPNNNPPAFTSAPRVDAVAGRAFTDTAVALDPESDALNYSLRSGPGGMVIDSATGVINWTPPANLMGSVQVEIEVSDNRGGIARQQYQIEVSDPAINHPPVFRSIPSTSTAVGSTYSYTPVVFDADTDTLSFANSVVLTGWSIDATTGAVTSPTLAEGAYPITIVATDGRGGRAEQSFVVGVGNVAASSVTITSQAPNSGTVGQQFAYIPTALSSTGRAIVYSISNLPANASFNSATGFIVWTPDSPGPRTFVLTAADGIGSAVQTFTVDVAAAPTNRAPVITSQPPSVATQNVSFPYAVSANDPDGDSITYSLTPETAALGVTIDSGTGQISWTPTGSQFGTYRLTVLASDNPLGAVGQQSFLVDVRAPNTAPVVSGNPAQSIMVGSSFITQFSASDAEGDTVRFNVAAGAPSGFHIDPVTGLALWQTTTADAGSHTITIRGTDERGAVGTYTFNLNVTLDTVAPFVAIAPIPLTSPGVPTTIQVFSTDNVDVASLVLTANGVPVTLDANGFATYTPSGPGIVRLVATSTDAAGNTTTVTASLRVSDPTDTTPPTVTISSPQTESLVTYLTDIVGTVDDQNLDTYRVEISRYGTNQWTTIATGTVPVSNSKLATFDPTLLDNDTYTVRLVASDVNGETSTTEIEIAVEGQAKLGNFRQEFTDLNIPLAGIPIQVIRVYDSLKADQSSDFGFGWSLGSGYDPQVRETRPSNQFETLVGNFASTPFRDGTRVYVNTPDGRRVGFTFEAKPYQGTIGLLGGPTDGLYMPYFRPDPGVFETLQGEYDGYGTNYPAPLQKVGKDYRLAAISVAYNPLGYKLTTKDGVTYTFGQFDGMRTITDRNNVTLTFTPNGITSSMGPGIVFTRDDAGRITAITDPNGKNLTYEYDANGDLTQVNDRTNAVTKYAYSDALPHYLAQINDPTGRETKRLDYDAAGRLIGSTDASGALTQSQNDLTAMTETVTDPLNRPTIFKHDQRGNVVQVMDPLGRISKYAYDANDNLISETDPRGMTTTRTFDAIGNPLTVTDPLGQTVTYTFTAFNFIDTMTDQNGVVHRKIYDDRGNLISQINPVCGCPSNVTYDGFGRPTSIQQPGSYPTVFGYSSSESVYPNGILRPNGAIRYVNYNSDGSPTYVLDENGHDITMNYDDENRLIQAIDSFGNDVKIEYVHNQQAAPLLRSAAISLSKLDFSDLVQSYTDQAGRVTYFTYDLNGQLVSKYNPLGGVDSYAYDAAGELISETDANGIVTNYTYDEAGELITASKAGATISIEYDAAGNMIGITDPNGHKTTYQFDGNNRLVKTIDPMGFQSIKAYDPVGRVISETDATGATTNYEFDDLGRKIGQTDALGNHWSWTYDSASNKLSETNPRGAVTQWTYNENSLVSTVVDANGDVTSYGYDLVGNKTSQTDANNHTTFWAYDSLDRLVSVTNANGGTQSFGYDPVGNKTEMTDANGNRTTYTFDDLNRMTGVTDAAGNTWQYGYDNVANLVSIVDPLNRETTFTYDGLDHWTQTVDAAGGKTTNSYDLFGNLLATTDATNATKHYTYDANDRLVTFTDTEGKSTQFEYDADGRQTKVTDPLNRISTTNYNAVGWVTSEVSPNIAITSYSYDAVGNLLTQTDPLNRTSSYSYDLLNRITTATDPAGGIRTKTYDSVGNLTSLTDESGNKTSFAYDSVDRVVSDTNALGFAETFSHDLAGNLTSSTDRNGRVRTFSYDNLNRQTGETWWSGGTSVRQINYTFDIVGNLLTVSDPDSTLTYTYDSLYRVQTASNAGTPNAPTVTLTYGYDALGRTTSVADNQGTSVVSAYNGRGQLTNRSWSSPSLGTASYNITYDAAGQRQQLNRFVGAVSAGSSTYSFDANGLSATIDHRSATNTLLASYDFTRDLAGQIQSLVELSGTTNYTYDSRGQVTSVVKPGSNSESFAFDATGNRTTNTTVGADNRLQSDARFDYAYDHDGNLITKTDHTNGNITTYSYDFRNRLTHVQEMTASGAVVHDSSYTYDVFDRLIRRVTDGVETRTVYNGDNALADYDANNQVTARYLYGENIDEIIARYRPTDGLAWYLSDHLGTVRDIVNAAGTAVIDHIEYTIFGSVISETNPSAGNRFKFTGREFDATTGLYFYRARWFDPGTGRFINQDPMGFAAGDTNLYRYVGNRPNGATDPSGMSVVYEDIMTKGLSGYVIGGVIGFICGYLDSISAGRSALDSLRNATLMGSYGAFLGMVLGIGLGALSHVSLGWTAFISDILLVYGGALGGYLTGTAVNKYQGTARFLCTVVPLVGPILYRGAGTWLNQIPNKLNAPVTPKPLVPEKGRSPFILGTRGQRLTLPSNSLTASEAAEIQAIANKYNTTIDVVGSRAAGKGRNIDTNLPMKEKVLPGEPSRSDIDFRIDAAHPKAPELIKDLQGVGNGAGTAGPKWSTNPTTPGGRPTEPPLIRFNPQ